MAAKQLSSAGDKVRTANAILDLWERIKPQLKKWWPSVLPLAQGALAYWRQLSPDVAISLVSAWLFLVFTYVMMRHRPPLTSSSGSQSVPAPQVAQTPESLGSNSEAELNEFYRTYDNAMLRETEDLVRAEIARIPTAERERYLTRKYSTLIVVALFEEIWRTIFRSQVLLLQALNTSSMSPDDIEKVFYIPTRDANPRVYERRSFHVWLGYLREQSLVTDLNISTIGLTIRGQEFLKYMVEGRRSPDNRFY